MSYCQKTASISFIIYGYLLLFTVTVAQQLISGFTSISTSEASATLLSLPTTQI